MGSKEGDSEALDRAQKIRACQLAADAVLADKEDEIQWFTTKVLRLPWAWKTVVEQALVDRDKKHEYRWKAAKNPIGYITTVARRIATKHYPDLVFGNRTGLILRPLERSATELASGLGSVRGVAEKPLAKGEQVRIAPDFVEVVDRVHKMLEDRGLSPTQIREKLWTEIGKVQVLLDRGRDLDEILAPPTKDHRGVTICPPGSALPLQLSAVQRRASGSHQGEGVEEDSLDRHDATLERLQFENEDKDGSTVDTSSPCDAIPSDLRDSAGNPDWLKIGKKLGYDDEECALLAARAQGLSRRRLKCEHVWQRLFRKMKTAEGKAALRKICRC